MGGASAGVSLVKYQGCSGNTTNANTSYTADKTIKKLYILVDISQAGGMSASTQPVVTKNGTTITPTVEEETAIALASKLFILSLDNIINGDVINVSYAIAVGNGNITFTFLE